MKKIILLVTFPLLFMFACSSNSMRINTFKQKEFIVDETKKVLMHVNERVTLEENEDVIIKNVVSCQSDKKGEFVYIVDPSSSKILKYNIQTGRVQNYYKIGFDLTDSLALSGKPAISAGTANEGRKMFFETIQKGKEITANRGYDSTIYCQRINNEVVSVVNYRGFLYATSTVRVGEYSDDDLPQIQSLANWAALLKFNYNLELLEVFFPFSSIKENEEFEVNKKFPLAGFFTIADDKVYMNAQNEINRNLNIYDSLTSVIRFDMELNEEKIIDFLPDEYSQSEQGYKLDFYSYFTSLNDQPYVAYPYGTKIKNLETGKEFELKNLPYTNKAGFDYLTKRANDFSLVSEQTLSASNRVNLLPIRIWDIFRHKDNLVVLLAVVKELAIDDYEYDFYLQEYTTDGELVKYAELDEITKYGALEKIAYDNYHRQFLLFRKNSQNWIVEKAKW